MLLAKDGFDVNTAAQASLKWSPVSSNGNLVTGIYGKGSAIANADRSKTPGPNTVTGFQGFHFFYATVAAVAICGWNDGVSIQTDLRLDATGAFFFTRNGTTIGSVATGNRISAPAWYWLCPKVKIDNTTGEASLQVNGVQILTQTGLDTQNTANAFFTTFNIKASNNNHAIDSWHGWDDSAGDNFNTYITETIIDTQLATAVGSNTNWTRGGTNTGNNFSQVNENPEDGDTTYNLSNTINLIDSFGFHNLDEISGAILDVAVNTVDRNDDGLAHILNHYVKSSSAVALSGSISPTASYLNHQSFNTHDPNTSANWLIAGRNAAEFGYKYIS